MKSFVKMFVSNKEVLKARHVKGWIIVLLFIVNVSLISVPNFVGKMQSIDIIDNLVGVEEAFNAIYDAELDCKVVDLKMECNGTYPDSFGDYNFIYAPEMNADSITESTIYFAEKSIAVIYVDDAEIATVISGDYSLLNGFDFSIVKTNEYGDLTQSEFYESTNDHVLTGIYYSTLSAQFSMIYLSQFLQILIYLIVVATIFLLMNFKANEKKLSFYNANKIIVASMTGPALLVAIMGVFFTGFASVLFFIIFAVRVMFLYYRMNFSKETYID